jgi:hypothetical protein
MLKAIKLIELYCAVCRYYDTVLAAEAQRMSNNCRPLFTGSERVTIYLFGIYEGMFTVKAAYGCQGLFSGMVSASAQLPGV